MSHLSSVLEGPVQVSLVVQQHPDGLALQTKLLVDLKGLLKHLIAPSNLTHSRTIKVVQTVDVVLDAALVSLQQFIMIAVTMCINRVPGGVEENTCCN